MGELRALIADDDPEMLELVSSVVEGLGIQVARAANGHELLDLIAHDRYDFIVTDISMPWMTGVQVMHSARAAGMPCPVLVMTALRDPRVLEQVYSLGEKVLLLLKPFSVDELKAAIDESLRHLDGGLQAYPQ